MLSLAITGRTTDNAKLHLALSPFIQKHPRRIEIYLKENESFNNHCACIKSKCFSPDRIDILAVASLLMTDIMVCDHHYGSKTHMASWLKPLSHLDVLASLCRRMKNLANMLAHIEYVMGKFCIF